MTTTSPKSIVVSEHEGLMLAIDSLRRVAGAILNEDGTLTQRTYGEGTVLDLARKTVTEIAELLNDVEEAATA